MKTHQYIPLLIGICLSTVTVFAETEELNPTVTEEYIQDVLDSAYTNRKDAPDKAIAYLDSLIKILGNAFPPEKAKALRYRGVAKKNKSLYEEAIADYQLSFKIDEDTNNPIGQVDALNLIGNVHKIKREYDKAVEFYIESLKIGESLYPNSREIGDTYNNLGSIFSILKKFEEANKYFKKALVIRRAAFETLFDPKDDEKTTERFAATYQDIGGMYFRMDSFDIALSYYEKSIYINEKIDNQYAIGRIYGNIGVMYYMGEDYEKTIKYYEKSLDIKLKLSDIRGIAITNNNLCGLHYNIKEYEKASKYCSISIDYAKEIKDYRVLINSELLIYRIAKAKGDSKKALTHYEYHINYKDSLNNNKKDIEIQKIISKYDRDIEIAAIEEKNQKQQILYITSILLTLMAIGFLAQYSITKEKLHNAEREKRIKEEDLRKESEGRRIEQQKLYKQVVKNLEQNAEIQAANTDIDTKLKERTKISSELHDSVCSGLVSAKLHLESVQNKIEEKDKATFAKGLYLLDDAYTTCRQISHDLNPPMLEKFGLTQAVEDICEKLTTPETDIQFGTTQFDERLTQQQELTLYQCIQELLQNILKHSAATEAHVQLTDYEDSLNILVEDNGKGFDTAEISDGGIGLQRIRTRVKHLGGSMDVDSSPGNGTTVIIDVPKALSTHEINA